jgi:uncharacterized Tic20 family protein
MPPAGPPFEPSPASPSPSAQASPREGHYASAKTRSPTPTQQEIDYAYLAHLLPAIANLIFLGFLVPVLAPIALLWAVKERSPFLMFHVHQSVLFQGVLFVTYLALLFFAGTVSLIVGVAAMPFYMLAFSIPIVGFVLPLPIGTAAKRGEWSEYPVVGQVVLRLRKPFLNF